MSSTNSNEYDLLLTLEEIFKGCTKEKRIEKNFTNPNGDPQKHAMTFYIDVKPGSREGSRIQFEVERDKDKASYFVCVIKIQAHNYFKRQNDDIVYICKLSEKDVQNKKILSIPTIDGDVLQVQSSGKTKTIPDRGLPIPEQPNKRGNFIISFEVQKAVQNKSLISTTQRQQSFVVVMKPYESRTQNRPIEHDMFLTLEEIYKGCTKTASIKRIVFDLNGRRRTQDRMFEVKIDAGAETGTKIIFEKEEREKEIK